MFNATFNNISVILAVSLIGGRYRSTWRKPPTCRKTQVTDKQYHIMVTTIIPVTMDHNHNNNERRTEN